ncbi:hypothetical protein [Helicobacter sp. T3_23-1056]
MAIYNQKLQKSVIWYFFILDCHADFDKSARNDKKTHPLHPLRKGRGILDCHAKFTHAHFACNDKYKKSIHKKLTIF